MKLKFTFLGILLITTVILSPAQDAHFSQYYASGLYLNPSIVGQEPGLMAGVNYRTQWRSIVIPYVTSQVTFIAPFYANNKAKDKVHIGGIGLSVYNDRAGDGHFNTLGVNINGAYNLYLSSRNVISFGIQGGFIQKSIDFADLQWGVQFNPYVGFDANINPSETTMNLSKLYPDIGAGFIYSFRTSQEERSLKGFLGGSAFHINRANESLIKSIDSRLPVLYKLHGGLSLPLSEKITLSPNVLCMSQNNVFQLNSGLYFSYLFNSKGTKLIPSDIIFGTWYRLKDSFIFSIGLANKNYLLGFSYDFNNSSLRYNTLGRGAYEISLSVRKKKSRDINRFSTPRI